MSSLFLLVSNVSGFFSVQNCLFLSCQLDFFACHTLICRNTPGAQFNLPLSDLKTYIDRIHAFCHLIPNHKKNHSAVFSAPVSHLVFFSFHSKFSMMVSIRWECKQLTLSYCLYLFFSHLNPFLLAFCIISAHMTLDSSY